MEILFGNEVNRYYLNKVRKIYADERRKITFLRTEKQALDYVKKIKEKVRSCFQFPNTKCLLNPVITGKISNKFCNAEKLYFFSRPGYPVTAVFFLPKKNSGKLPAVLFVCGHAADGKANRNYQTACISLVKKGFAVLAVDPIGQGERISLVGRGFPEFNWKSCCHEHNEEGKQLLLSGEWFGAWRTYDGIRAVDYLLTRPEVDPKRIGLTGNSGGGTLTTWINAVEDRLCMAAPSCYITTWRNNVENELPADVEQMPPAALSKGLEMADFLLASAPRPLLIMGQKNDFFDHRGTLDTFRAVKHVYDLIGGKIEYFIGPVNHGYSLHNREAMYSFFTKNAFNKVTRSEGKVSIFSAEETWAAPHGNIANIPQYRSFRELESELADQAVAERKRHSLSSLRKKIRNLIKPGKTFEPYYRVLRLRIAPDTINIFSRFGLETERGEIMSVLKQKSTDPVYFYHLSTRVKKILLYIPHLDSQEEMLNRKILSDYQAVYGLDMRGIGEMTPCGCDQPTIRDFFNPYQFDFHYANLAFMLASPMLGKRVHDILCTVELLTRDGALLEIEAFRQGCIPALMAAVLSDKISRIHLIDCLDSYYSLTQTPASWWPYAVLVPDVLRNLDLPELRKAIADKLF